MSDTSRDVTIYTGGFHFGSGHTRIRTLLGSCVAVTLWHPEKRIGGMCHYLLPGSRATRQADTKLPGLFASGALELFMRELRSSSTQPRDYVAKLFGGGSMFPEHLPPEPCAEPCDSASREACRDVPCKNVLEGRDLLQAAGFAIAAEHVGGVGARSLLFDIWTGDVWLRQAAPVAVECGAGH